VGSKSSKDHNKRRISNSTELGSLPAGIYSVKYLLSRYESVSEERRRISIEIGADCKEPTSTLPPKSSTGVSPEMAYSG
jgi:hypothetical protein